MPWLSTWSVPEPSTIAPTRIGTPIAELAARMPELVSASSKGSTAVEFSGHTTRSGCGTSPASTCRARSTVASTWFWVTWR